MDKQTKGLLVLFAILLIVVAIFAATWGAGERHVLKGLLADGYDVVIDRSIRVGEGRYTVRVWERSLGWMAVER